MGTGPKFLIMVKPWLCIADKVVMQASACPDAQAEAAAALLLAYTGDKSFTKLAGAGWVA